MKIKRLYKKLYSEAIVLMTGLYYQSAFASAGGVSMPWDDSLQKIESNLAGPTAHISILIAVVLGGVGFAYGEHGSIFRKAMGILIGGSVAVGSASLFSEFWGSGAVI